MCKTNKLICFLFYSPSCNKIVLNIKDVENKLDFSPCKIQLNSEKVRTLFRGNENVTPMNFEVELTCSVENLRPKCYYNVELMDDDVMNDDVIYDDVMADREWNLIPSAAISNYLT